MELPKRKQIRLKEYDYSQSGAYFATICTHKRNRLFGEIDPVGAHLRVRPNNPEKIIEKWLFEIENKYSNAKIDAYVIMPDHVHFIIFNVGVYNENTGVHTGTPLPEIIKWFKTQTTNEYIKGVKRGLFPPFDRHIWHRNYFEHAIRNEKDLNETRQYIADNPQKWLMKEQQTET